MIRTTLDDLMMTAFNNRSKTKLFGALYKTLVDLKPVSIYWPICNVDTVSRLPKLPIQLPHRTIVIMPGTSVATNPYVMQALSIPHNHDAAEALNERVWSLDSILLYQNDDEGKSFDVIGLLTALSDGTLMVEIQLTCMLNDYNEWAWSYNKQGIVNANFYNELFMDQLDTPELLHAVDMLGTRYEHFIATWIDYLQHDGEWKTYAAKPAKLKYNKRNKPIKVLRKPLLGYKQYVHNKSL